MARGRRYESYEVRRWLGVAEGELLQCAAVVPDQGDEPLRKLGTGLQWLAALLGSWGEKLLVFLNVVPAVRGILEQLLLMAVTIGFFTLIWFLAQGGSDEECSRMVRTPFLIVFAVACSGVAASLILQRRAAWRQNRCAVRARAHGHGIALLVAGEWHEFRWTELRDVAQRGSLWQLRFGDYDLFLRSFGAPKRLVDTARRIMHRQRPRMFGRLPIDLIEAPDGALSRARPLRLGGERGLSRAEEEQQSVRR